MTMQKNNWPDWKNQPTNLNKFELLLVRILSTLISIYYWYGSHVWQTILREYTCNRTRLVCLTPKFKSDFLLFTTHKHKKCIFHLRRRVWVVLYFKVIYLSNQCQKVILFQSVIKNSFVWRSRPCRGYPPPGVDVHARHGHYFIPMSTPGRGYPPPGVDVHPPAWMSTPGRGYPRRGVDILRK